MGRVDGTHEDAGSDKHYYRLPNSCQGDHLPEAATESLLEYLQLVLK